MMKNNIILNNNKGFSLIEMLIAITIFAVGLLAMAQLQTHSIVYNAQAQRFTEATIIAQGELEKLKAMNSANNYGLIVTKGPVPEGAYDITVDVYDGPKLDTKTVDILVEWKYKGDKNYTLTTVIAKHTKPD